MTANEEAVIKKEVENRIAEREKDGTKLTKKEKAAIRDLAEKDLEKGYISTDTIEEVLGGESYKRYKDTSDKLDTLQAEYDKLYKMKNGDKSDEQIDRQAELKKQLEEMKRTFDRTSARTKLNDEVYEKVKGDRLAESYNEMARRHQTFQADLSKYDEKQQAVIQKAVDSGILNNSNRTHEFVDLVARISADKGVLFDFVNNQKLRESGFSVDGATVNGYVTKDGVTLNIQSTKALNKVVGHEITHVLEGTEFYDALQDAVIKYAKSKGEYDSRLEAITDLYKQNDPDADPVKELTADLVGDYLFSDLDFIKNLSTNHRNVFQKVYDEVKYLCKVATAGSKEARQLEKVKKAFEDAYKADRKANGGAKYSLSEIVDKNNKSYGIGVHLDSTLLDNLTPTERLGMVKEYVKELGGESFTAYDNNGNAVDVTIAKSNARFKNQRGKRTLVNKDLTTKHIGNEVKQEAIALIDELIVAAEYDGSKAPQYPHGWLDNNGRNDWEYWTTYIQDKNNTIWEATLNIANTANGEKILYDISPIKKVGQSVKSDTIPTDDNIAQEGSGVKQQFSLANTKAIAPVRSDIYGKDIELIEKIGAPIRDDLPKKGAAPSIETVGAPIREDIAQSNADAESTNKSHVSLEDYANQKSPVWRNVEYSDDTTKTRIMQQMHDDMLAAGAVVTVADTVINNVEQAFPDLRSMKKKERNPILKSAMTKLKNDLRQFLNGFKNQSFEFEVNGKVLDATLYNTGINEVLEKVTKDKASMLYSTEEIFRNARYLYSTPDYDGDPNVYRWNYFYTPVQIGEETVGVRIAVRDMVKGTDGATSESQIYSWGIKKDASLGGGSHDPKAASSDASSDASNNSISENGGNVNAEQKQIAKILTEEPSPANRKSRAWAKFKANVLDKGAVFEDLSLRSKNRELIAKWNFMLTSEARAQQLMGNGTTSVKSLNAIREEVGNTGKTKQFYDYLYHKHNIDRMQLAERHEGTPNKPVFGDSVTADVSQGIVDQLEKVNPEFKQYAQDVYNYMNHLRQLLVENGVISQETADLWTEMYPNYVPIRRKGNHGLNINVPLDTNKTGVNAPVKKATGGSSDIMPLFETMAQRTVQTYKAIAKNSFGVELKNALGSTIANEATSVDEVIDSIDTQDGLLQEGKNGSNPTFTVFENGEKVTYEITKDMYDALKPVSEGMACTIKILNTASNFHRGLLTEFNPTFMLTNAIKDVQDILINSQHPLRTYRKIPEAYAQMFKKGYWYNEYMEAGGEQNTYFDKETNTFGAENKGLAKLLDIPPLSTVSKINNFIEMAPRLAEYIASRESGRSVEVSMLDAARVTTNFAAGGDLTKLLNRNGATFLNASIQGAMQQVRNVREAKMNGLKGWVSLATRFAFAGLPALLLNNLLWDDDEEYAELSDYVKQNYYIIKYGDGQFFRIPKGRTLAVIQNAFEQVSNALTGDDEVDLASFLNLALSNLAPNNPIENNILAPIIQVANNETWYGEDLVPSRLQDLPATEQFDESTDAISKWLGEKLNYSPVKINYLLDQYSGGVGDVVLPMLTPEAESGNNSFLGNVIAPMKDKFTTDSVMNNQNISDFYATMDTLTTNAKASTATDEDVLMSKYMNSVNAELSELYAYKRNIQNSKYSDEMKYSLVRKAQERINDLTRNSLASYTDVSINGDYATVGDRYFHLDDFGEWKKMSDDQVSKYKATSAAGDAAYATDGKSSWHREDGKADGKWIKNTDDQIEKQWEVTTGLGITPEEYWGSKEEYDYAYENPEKYTVAKSVGGYDVYKTYSNRLNDIKADKDENGKTISGSRKEKVIDYINNLDADYGAKIILYKSEYPSDDTYNYEIVDYLNSRDDISYSEMETILKELGFIVDAEGNVTWD